MNKPSLDYRDSDGYECAYKDAVFVSREKYDALRQRHAEAEAALSLASQAIDERLSGLSGDPLQDVADAINRYYADSASGEGEKC